jgi:hypothetical protein
MIKFWKYHSLSISLSIVFLAMLIASWPLGRTLWDGKGEYFYFWLGQTIFSLEADVFGGIILVLFTKWFKERHSASSNPPKNHTAM